MSEDRPHSRSGPGATTGARAGAHGIADVPLGGSEPLPMEPGQEYVAKADHDAVVEQLTSERDAMKGDLQRIAADFENFKRRSAAQRDQASAAAETRLLGELLTVLDDVDRAIEHADSEGLQTVKTRLEGVIAAHGVTRIPTDGEFDTNLHEAMMVQPAEGVADGTIVQVLQSGWTVGDRVLRHARVIVAGGGE